MFPFSIATRNLTTANILRHTHHSTDDVPNHVPNHVPKNEMCENEIAKDKCALCGAEIPIGKKRCACGGCGIDALKKSRIKSNKCSVCGIGLDVLECWMDDGVVYCKECYNKHINNQSAKADSGKPNLSLVPTQIIYEIEKVRAFGSKKYKDPDNWKKVEIERYHQALLRHALAVWDDINAKDKESGLLHLSHMATNIAFILELMNEDNEDV
jgi:hypothetical protein